MALVDLFGDSLPDVLHTSQAGFRYWRNLGEGALDRPRFLDRAPAGLTLSTPGVGLADANGDGRLELMVHEGAVQGFWEATPEGDWDAFRPYPEFPGFDLEDPNLRLVDLTGDGLADALVTRDHHFVWFPGQGADGYGDPQAIERIYDREAFPDVFFSDPEGRVRLADMTGDGLADIVWIHSGSVEYWSNLGYGSFSRKLQMARAPTFDFGFDPARLFLADLNGDGCADLVYVDFDRVHYWINRSGNSWSDRQTVFGTPAAADARSVQFADIYGTGTATLLWTYDFAFQPGGNYKTLDFCGGTKPHLLVEMRNNLGATTRVRYASSAVFAARDRVAGTPWVTPLAFPVMVVEAVETIDHIGGTKLATRYAYHHGYYDRREREFRGFGRVDQFDAEEFATFAEPGLHPDGVFTNALRAHYVPPVTTRTWFHTGAWFEDGNRLELRYESEYYAADSASYRSGACDLPGDDLSRDAARTLKGAVLRTEIYAHDGTDRAPHPYLVTEQSHRVVRAQDQGSNSHAVYFTTPAETLTHHYERNPSDPRVEHHLTLATDAYANVTHAVAIAYPRRGIAPYAEQSAAKGVLTWKRFINTPDDPALADFHYVGVPCETRTYEVAGLGMLRATGKFAKDDFAPLDDPDDFSPYDVEPLGTGKRLLEWERRYFRAGTDTEALDPFDPTDAIHDYTHRLPLGTIGALGLEYETYRTVLTPGLIDRLFEGSAGEASLREAGYIRADAVDATAPQPAGTADYWWLPSGRVAFEAPGTGFCRPTSTQNPFGHTSLLEYDRYSLLMTRAEDALHNNVHAESDYRVLQTAVVTDANGSRSGALFDELGFIVATALMGRAGDNEADSLPQLSELDNEAVGGALDPVARASGLLGSATSRMLYDLDRWQREGLPAVVWSLSRETHVADLGRGDTSRVRHKFVYSDGFGRVLHTKVQAEAGAVDGDTGSGTRWVGTGSAVFNNKGQPVQEFEPFFSRTYEFEPGRRDGHGRMLFYDPLGRVIARIHPNHTYEKVAFDPWRQSTWDPNDTVLLRPGDDPDVSGYVRDYLGAVAPYATWYDQRILDRDQPGPASSHSPEQDAALKAAAHAATPTEIHHDALGRGFLTVTSDGVQMVRTSIVLDVQGNDLAIIDARGLLAFTHGFDMLRRKVRVESVDAGLRRTLQGPDGTPHVVWDANGNVISTMYDALRRPTAIVVANAQGPRRVQQVTYGEDFTDVDQRRARGRPVRVRDGAGESLVERYDFKGNALITTRRLPHSYQKPPDWAVPVRLETEVYRIERTFDALNRTIEDAFTTPAGERYSKTVAYNEAGLLEWAAVQLPEDQAPEPLVQAIEYNEKGQRLSIVYGNGATTRCTYDDRTYRLLGLRTTRGADPDLQQLEYTYDPVGNITRIHDGAFATVFNARQRVDPTNLYTYDALYRLTEARGREHEALSACHYAAGDQRHTEFIPIGPQPIENGRAVGNYTERYSYDSAGNLRRIEHYFGLHRKWVREQAPAPSSNRLASTTSDNGCWNEPFAVIHDASGNVVALPHLPAIEWDHANQLISAETNRHTYGPVDSAYYAYAADGGRLRKVLEVGGNRVEERIYLGGFEVFRSYGANGQQDERHSLHVVDDKSRIALVDRQLDLAGGGSAARYVRYQLGNHLGSSLVELDEGAEVIAHEEYLPYGGSAYAAGRDRVEIDRRRYRYAGKECDGETGLYFYGARYYAPWLGRWLSCDPAGVVDGTNLYQFVRGNPISLRDAVGHYGEAGHFYTVYYVSLAAGFPEDVAFRNAFYAQLPDEVCELDALDTYVWKEATRQDKRLTGDYGVAQYDRNVVHQGLHSLTGRSVEDERPLRRQLVGNAVPGTLEAGLALHAFGDSYAHSKNGRMYSSGVGHGFDGHAPDQIQTRPDLYDSYVRDLYSVLAQSAQQAGYNEPHKLTETELGIFLDKVKAGKDDAAQIQAIREYSKLMMGVEMRPYAPEHEETVPWAAFQSRHGGNLDDVDLTDTLRLSQGKAARWDAMVRGAIPPPSAAPPPPSDPAPRAPASRATAPALIMNPELGRARRE